DTRTLGLGLSLISKGGHSLFAARLKRRHPVVELLKHVMDGDPVSAERLLKQHQQKRLNECLVTMRSSGKEKNLRRWDNVSALEFSAWTGDMTDPEKDSGSSGMVNVLLKYVPLEHKQEALKQMQGIKDHGTEHGNQMSPFFALIEAYRKYY